MSRAYGMSIRPIKRPAEWIDLGLPSGILWHRMNLGATNPTDSGLYYAWGETTGYADAAARNAALGRSDGFSEAAHKATGAESIVEGSGVTNGILDLTKDAAYVALGSRCRIPTGEECREIINTDYVTISSSTIGTKDVTVITSKINGKKIIFPYYREINGMTITETDNAATYWSSELKDYARTGWSQLAGKLMTDNNAGYGQGFGYLGMPIRPVKEPAVKFVDLGLPSGLLWADRNVGAESPEDDGLYFQWGDTVGHSADERYDFSEANYNAKGLNNISGDLTLSNDAANAILGGGCRIPTKIEA